MNALSILLGVFPRGHDERQRNFHGAWLRVEVSHRAQAVLRRDSSCYRSHEVVPRNLARDRRAERKHDWIVHAGIVRAVVAVDAHGVRLHRPLRRGFSVRRGEDGRERAGCENCFHGLCCPPVVVGATMGFSRTRNNWNLPAGSRMSSIWTAAGIATSREHRAAGVTGCELEHAIETAGYATAIPGLGGVALPTGQAAESAQYLWDVADGHIDPVSWGQFMHGLIYGPPRGK